MTIPASVNTIGDGAFMGCIALTAFHVAEGNLHYSDIDGVLFNADKTTLLLYPSGKEDISYTIPNGTISITEQAIHIEIFDLQGRIVYQGAQTNINLPEGIYLVRGKGVNRKVMITK